MSVQGKKRDEWVALTLTDFGDPNRREVLRHHFSVEAAYRAWESICKTYTAPWSNRGQRVWQEIKGGDIINEDYRS
jgi:hypothetical protein